MSDMCSKLSIEYDPSTDITKIEIMGTDIVESLQVYEAIGLLLAHGVLNPTKPTPSRKPKARKASD